MADARRAAVTGGTGFVGANLVRRLLADGWQVDLLLRPGHATWRLPPASPALAAHLVDLTDVAATQRLLRRLRPAHVFHLAAQGAYSWQTDAAEILSTNLLATRGLALAAVEAGVESLVHAGSSSEYGRKAQPPPEDALPEPESDYAIAKLAATQFCRQLARRSGVRMPTLRLYSAYGPWEEPRRLVPALLVHGLEGEWPPLTDPATARDFVWVGDVVDALLLAAACPLADPGAVFNIGTGRQTRLAEIVALVRDVLGIGAEPAWQTMPGRAWDTDAWQAEPSRAWRELGWVARTGLREGLAQTAEWLRAEPARLDLYRDALGMPPARPRAQVKPGGLMPDASEAVAH